MNINSASGGVGGGRPSPPVTVHLPLRATQRARLLETKFFPQPEHWHMTNSHRHCRLLYVHCIGSVRRHQTFSTPWGTDEGIIITERLAEVEDGVMVIGE
jgi:hypothetical protein